MEYPVEEILREKYRAYQGLKNFKTSEWNHLENLPEEFDQIYSFRNYGRTQKTVLLDNEARGFAYEGFYIKVTVKGAPKDKVWAYM